MHFKGKDWRRFRSKKAAPKVPEWPSYGNFCKVTQNPHFLKKCKGGTKRCPRLKGPKALWRKWHYPLISIHLKGKTGQDLGAHSGSKGARTAKLWQFLQGHPKLAFSVKVQRETKENFSKIAQKVALV